MKPDEHDSEAPDLQPVIDAVRRHHVAPEPPVENMWLRVRAAIPRAAARRRRSRVLKCAAAIGAMVLLGVIWPDRDGVPVDSRRVDTLRASVSELDLAIRDLDAILRSDPANHVVKEMRARFDRQRDAWLARKE